MRIMVFYNQSSGSDQALKIAEKFAHYTKEHHPQQEVFLQEISKDLKPADYPKKAEAKEVDTLVFIGGDGTIRHMVQDFSRSIDKYNIGIIPGGTVNNFARSLELPVNAEAAFPIIFEGHQRLCDYGVVNQDVMVSSMTVGILADTAASISQKDKQKYGKLIFVRNFIKMVLKKKRYRFEIETDEKTWQESCQLLAVTMTNSIGGFTHFDSTARVDDGLFHVTILPRLHIWRYLFYLPKILSGRIYQLPDVQYFHTSTLKLSGMKKAQARIDGDPADYLPLNMKVETKKLQIFVPE
ncbi:diacylglycerol/lipid kinase family protein [Enterococcus sp. LJL90]